MEGAEGFYQSFGQIVCRWCDAGWSGICVLCIFFNVFLGFHTVYPGDDVQETHTYEQAPGLDVRTSHGTQTLEYYTSGRKRKSTSNTLLLSADTPNGPSAKENCKPDKTNNITKKKKQENQKQATNRENDSITLPYVKGITEPIQRGMRKHQIYIQGLKKTERQTECETQTTGRYTRTEEQKAEQENKQTKEKNLP